MTSADLTTLGAILKVNYADKIQNLVPVENRLQKLLPFSRTPSMNGKHYSQPVVVRNNQAVTIGTGSFTMLDPISMVTQDAQISGMQAALALDTSYDVISRSDGAPASAFQKATDLNIRNGITSFHNRLEVLMLYGQDTLGTTASGVATSSTSETVTFTAAGFSAGIWSISEGASVNFYDVSGNLVSSSTNAIFTVSIVNASTPSVLFTGSSTGCTALHTAVNAGACTIHYHQASSIPATDSATSEMYGLKKQLTNTGTLFNIDAATYGLWKGNTYSAGTARLTVGKLLSATALAVSRGLGSKAWVFVSPTSFANISSDLAGLRRFTDDDSTSKLGTTVMEIFASNGSLSVMPHRFVKDGDAFIIPQNEPDDAQLDTAVAGNDSVDNRNYRVCRPGSSDVSFTMTGKNMIWNSPTAASLQSRLWSDQAIFLSVPAQGVYISAISNS